jgi:hypothetical protein
MDGWRKSSYSDGNGGQCVEVTSTSGVKVRDSTTRERLVLTFTAEAWERFTASLK